MLLESHRAPPSNLIHGLYVDFTQETRCLRFANERCQLFTIKRCGGLRDLRAGRKRRPSFRVTIAIFSMQRCTIACMNPFDHAERPSGDFEIAIAFNRYSSHIHAHFFPFGHGRFDQVASLETLNAAWPFGATARKTELIHIHHVTSLSACGFNQPGTDVPETQAIGSRCPDNGCINPVRLGERHPAAIPASSSSSPYLHWQTECLQFLIEPPARAIDRCRVGQRRFKLRLDPSKQVWSVSQKHFDGLISFGLVACPARNHQVRNAMRTSTRAWVNVVDFESACGSLAVRALMLPLGEQIILD